MPALHVAVLAHIPHLPRARGRIPQRWDLSAAMTAENAHRSRTASADEARRRASTASCPADQLRGLGLSESAIAHAIDDRPAAPRVPWRLRAWRRRQSDKRGRLRAAVLACGDGAVDLASQRRRPPGPAQRGTCRDRRDRSPRSGREIDGIRFHRVRPPRRDEVGTVDGIPCTSPARTLGRPRRHRRRLDAAELLRAGGAAARCSTSRRSRRRWILDGAASQSLRALVDEWRRAAPIARKGKLKSPLEAKVLPLLAPARPPHPAPQRAGRDRQRPHRGRLPLARPPTSSSRPTAATSTAPRSPSSATAGATAN